MSLITDIERIEKAKMIKSYRDSFIADKQGFDFQIDAITDPAQPFGFLGDFIAAQEAKIVKMQSLKSGMTTGDQEEIDILIGIGQNKIQQMKNKYKTKIYNKIHGA
jgi:hypothetical protein